MTTRVWTAAGALAALLWLVFDGGPAAVAAALLVTTVAPPPTVEGIVMGGGALVAVPAALAIDEPAAAVGLVAVLVAARLVVAVRQHRDRELPVLPGLGVVGAALLGLALLAVRADEGTWTLQGADDLSVALALAGAVAVLIASAPPTAVAWTRVLVVPALVIGLPAADALPASAVAVVLGAAALVAAWFAGPALPLAALALLAAAVPGGLPAASLLAAAAVLATPFVERGPAPAVLGLPGGVALAAAVVAGPVSVPRVAAALALVGVVGVLATRRADFDLDTKVELPLVPTLAVSAWLLLAPATWDWVGDARIDHWDLGAALAAAAGIAAVVGRRRLSSLLERR